MIKLMKNFSLKNWITLIILVILTFAQVMFTMLIVDYISVITKAIQIKDLDAIWNDGILICLFAIGLVVTQLIIEVIASWNAADIVSKLREKIYDKVNAFSLQDLNYFSTESLITRTTNDLQNIHLAYLTAFRVFFMVPVMIGWSVIKLLGSNLMLSISSIAWIVLLIIVVAVIILMLMPKFGVLQKYTDALNVVTRENLTGIRVIRAFNAENYQEDKFTKVNNDFTKVQLFTSRAIALLSPFIMFVLNGLTLTILWVSAFVINKTDPTIAIDTFTQTNSFVMLASQIIIAFVLLITLIVVWPRATVCAKRIREVLRHDISLKDKENPKSFKEKGTIEFKKVSFAYPESDGDAVSDISFKVKKGETLAFIGATGSGKSTIVNLIPRLYDATKGSVFVDGVNVKDVRQKDLKEIIGYVPQRGYLFKGTIKENIAFSDPSMDLDRIIKAADVAEASSFVNNLDDKYDSPVAQGGTNFSGGQKQRLCIARAIAKHPEILIFDDSFSALDYKTDKQVRTNIKKFDKNVTKVIIAARIGTIMDAEQIVVLDKGKIVGIGKHKDLLKKCDVYREIALSQLSKEELGL